MGLFGESPRDTAARNQLSFLQSLFPQMQKSTFDLASTWKEVMSGLDQSTSFATSSLSQALGKQLANSGIAGGQPRSEAYISALAPLYASNASTKANVFSDLSKFAATNDNATKQLLLALTGQEGNMVDAMKSSTSLGDILGLLQTFATVGGAVGMIPGAGDFIKNLFGKSAGSSLTPTWSGKITPQTITAQ